MTEILNADYLIEETLDGKTVSFPRTQGLNHGIVSENIYFAFRTYLHGKILDVIPCKTDVYLTEKDRVCPDVAIVSDRTKLKSDGAHGVPELVVEVLSPMTAKYDKGYKYQLYEECGVEEYWIVSTLDKIG